MQARGLVLAALLAGCGFLPASISRDQAISIAVANSGLANPVLVNASTGNSPLGMEPREAWIVILRGSAQSCDGPGVPGSPESEPCHAFDGQAVVYVDQHTGNYLGGSVGTP